MSMIKRISFVVILVLLCTRTIYAAPVQQVASSAGATTFNVTLTANATIGNLVILTVDGFGATAGVSSVSGLGNTWTKVLGEVNGNTHVDIWTTTVGTATNTVTIN